ncbi:gp53-like domain-containing protein [Enterobacter roggenkampii]|uniref:gp53-like domain-containing protein n=1 Tax=Enterobacter roggenkampii TaxID=1812935 RepID=UPI003BCD58E0
MYFVDNGSAVPVMPQVKPVSSATPQFFTEGGNGTPPTYPGPDWFNIVQTELLNLLKEAGIDPDKANHAQLLAAMKKLFLTRSNPFADIKADGPAAVAAALSNLGLRTAAKRDVGNSTNQVPDMSFFTLGLSGAFRLPTGHIIQTGGGTAVGGGFTQAYPYPFPGSCQALVGIVYGTLGQRAFVTSNSSDRTAANLNVVDINGNGLNASIGYIAIGY